MQTLLGTPTWEMERFGSGEMTVRPEKSTRFPERLPRKRPVLPLRRWLIPRSGLAPVEDGGRPGRSELMYLAVSICRYSQFSMRRLMETPLLSASRMMEFTWKISVSFMVRSSSVEPTVGSRHTLGRMQSGGTGMYWRMSRSGRPTCACISRSSTSSGTILRKISSARSGLRSSKTRSTCLASSGFAAMASANSGAERCQLNSERLGFCSTWMMRRGPIFLTWPLKAPQ
mmetsp:Transcript_10924/g.28760  ORF Transcript_10924/g.28760 Transcript_10924/m.28760 type:complete len:229 (+) Transcript_10924:49-735(+)